MEFMGRPCPSGACSLLEVPGLGSLDPDDDEGEVVIGIRPKSSPLPRRRSSLSDEDSEPEPPVCGSRRVSFADAKGLSLVHVKEFEMWEIPALPRNDFSEGNGPNTDDYFLSFINFSLPLPDDELFIKVRDQKVVLQTLELLPGTTTLRGVVRVLNVSYSKAVYVRTSLDTWSSHFDLLAAYVPGSSDGQRDSFSFQLTLVPPSWDQGTRVDFCLRYETPAGTFWANNDNGNYVLFLHQGPKDKPGRENLNKRSCLKLVSQNVENNSVDGAEASSEETVSAVGAKRGQEVTSVTDELRTDDHSATSQEEQQKLRAENRRNSSGRRRRGAARMALLRKRDGGENDTTGDESAPDGKQAATEGAPVGKPPEAGSQSEASPTARQSADSCIKPLGEVLNETSAAHDEPEKPETSRLAASAGGERATHNPDQPAPSNGELPSQNRAEGQNPRRGGKEHESAESPNNSFLFGSIVAPLYHQVSARAGGKNHSTGASGTRRRPPQVETVERSSTDATDASRNDDGAQNDVSKMQEGLDAPLKPPPTDETPQSPSVRADAQQHPVTDSLKEPEGEAQEDVTFDLQTQAGADAAQNKLSQPERTQDVTTPVTVTTDDRTEDHLLRLLQSLTTHETSPQTQEESCNTTEINHLHQSEEERTAADHMRGDVGAQSLEEPNDGSENVKHGEMEVAAAGPEEFEVTTMDGDKEKSTLTEGEEDEVGHVEAIGRETETEEERTDEGAAAETRKAQTTQREARIRGNEVERREEQEVSIKKANVGSEEMEADERGEAGADPERDDPVNQRQGHRQGWDYDEEMPAEEETTLDADSQGVTLAGSEDGAEREAITQNEVEDGSSAPLNNRQQADGIQTEAQREEEAAGERHDSASAESDSDDEVELYMRCLRAVHAGTRAQKDREAAAGKRPAASKAKNPSPHMPSISESLDEEQALSEDVQPSGGQETEASSCSSVSRTLLWATPLLVFLFVAYHYDFFACFALYLVSVVWLCCQGDTQPVKNNKKFK